MLGLYYMYLLKKNLVLAFAGADTLVKVHESNSLGLIIGGLLNKSAPLPESFQDTFTCCFASLCNSSVVLRYGIYDFLSCIYKI